MLRWLRRSPPFTLTITAILAPGIGVNTAIFSSVDAVLLRPLPYTAANRLVRIRAASSTNPTIGISARDYFPWRSRTDLFERTIPYVRDIATITGAGDPDQVVVVRTPGELFAMLGARANVGRALAESDEGVAVLSYRLWQRRFHGDPSVVGRMVRLSDEAFTVAGVIPPDFDFLRADTEMWTPLPLVPSATTRVELVARLARDKTPQQAQSALESMAAEMRRVDPRTYAGLNLVVEPWRDAPNEQYESTLVLVLAAVGLAPIGSLPSVRSDWLAYGSFRPSR
jgi:hypothetical protein